jgi:hypothetical protein
MVVTIGEQEKDMKNLKKKMNNNMICEFLIISN